MVRHISFLVLHPFAPPPEASLLSTLTLVTSLKPSLALNASIRHSKPSCHWWSHLVSWFESGPYRAAVYNLQTTVHPRYVSTQISKMLHILVNQKPASHFSLSNILSSTSGVVCSHSLCCLLINEDGCFTGQKSRFKLGLSVLLSHALGRGLRHSSGWYWFIGWFILQVCIGLTLSRTTAMFLCESDSTVQPLMKTVSLSD